MEDLPQDLKEDEMKSPKPFSDTNTNLKGISSLVAGRDSSTPLGKYQAFQDTPSQTKLESNEQPANQNKDNDDFDSIEEPVS